MRYLNDSRSVQRWLCRDCGLRFSLSNEKPLQKNSHWQINTAGHSTSSRQICALDRRVENLAAIETKAVVGEVKTLQETTSDIDARVTQYEWKCRKRGLQQNTIDLRKYHLSRLVKDGANLNSPDTVETVLATKDYRTPTKWLLVNAYRSYCKTFNIQWEPIRIRYQPKMPYIPTEEECNIFIAGLSRTISVFCRVLFETGARRGEACKMEWTDINEEKCTIAISHPEKGSNARVNRVSRECIDLLKRLPKRYGNYVFSPMSGAYDGSFCRQRKRIAEKSGKPQFLRIHFHTFRHVRGTLDIHNNIPLFEVKENLGHRCVANTEKYIHWNRQLYHERNDRYHFASVSTDEEAGKLIETGWQHICNNPTTGSMLFRKPK